MSTRITVTTGMNDYTMDDNTTANNNTSSTTTNPSSSEDRAAAISAKLKQIYNKSILPVEKKYKYDYFFESPLLSDVEFDGTYFRRKKWKTLYFTRIENEEEENKRNLQYRHW